MAKKSSELDSGDTVILANCETEQTVAGTLSVGGLKVDGVKFKICTQIDDPPEANTLYIVVET